MSKPDKNQVRITSELNNAKSKRELSSNEPSPNLETLRAIDDIQQKRDLVKHATFEDFKASLSS